MTYHCITEEFIRDFKRLGVEIPLPPLTFYTGITPALKPVRAIKRGERDRPNEMLRGEARLFHPGPEVVLLHMARMTGTEEEKRQQRYELLLVGLAYELAGHSTYVTPLAEAFSKHVKTLYMRCRTHTPPGELQDYNLDERGRPDPAKLVLGVLSIYAELLKYDILIGKEVGHMDHLTLRPEP
jgi:hypothetical protein